MPTRSSQKPSRGAERRTFCPSAPARASRVADRSPQRATFRREVMEGLRADPKRLPCKYFYDERGSELFERICELPEYYPTRLELSIMESHAGPMARALGPGCLLIEYGSGASRKTRLLLDALEYPAGYVPVDISRSALEGSAAELSGAYPDLEILPVCADYTQPFEVPRPNASVARRAVYFPGSTIGNLTPPQATGFLGDLRERAGDRGLVLIGFDLQKDAAVLEAAYDDAEGVTAAFNRNLLVRINRELDADFELDGFRHHACYDPDRGRVEMHLVSDRDQTARIGDAEIRFQAGETIHTESSYKYTLDGFADLAARAGLRVRASWTDSAAWFAVQLLEPEAGAAGHGAPGE